MKSYVILAIIILLIGVFWGGIIVGKMGIVTDLSDQKVERQKKITEETLALAKKKKELEAESRKNQEILRNVKDSCADTMLPKPFADILR